MASGSRDGLNFGQTYVVNPTRVHKATIVWFHDIMRTGSDSEKVVRSLKNPNIKWICPTAPTRPVTSLNDRRTTAWFDVSSNVCEGMQDDFDSLNFVTTHVTTLLSSEPPHVVKGVGGIGMGAAQALFYASVYALGRVPIDIEIVIGINGWLPDFKSLKFNMANSPRSLHRAAALRILITHGSSADTIPTTFAGYSLVNRSVDSLRLARFRTTYIPCGGSQAIKEIRTWLLEDGLQT